MQNIDDFIDNLLSEKLTVDVESDIKADLKNDMKKQLEEQINRAAAQSLPEEKAAELAKLIDQPDFNNEKIADFMADSGVDFDKITKDTMSQFRKFYLGTEEN